MSHAGTLRQKLIEPEYEPLTSSRKLGLLLQRSVRYSYRQRCCNCCPTILCELLFPLVLIILLVLTRYGINRLAAEQMDDGSLPGTFSKHPCSKDFNITATSSNDIFAHCFKFPPSYASNGWGPSGRDDISNRTDIIFEPNRDDIKELVERAQKRLEALKCEKNVHTW